MNSNLQPNHDELTKLITTENFNISLSIHEKNSQLAKHSHNKPYLCLLVSGMYKEKGFKNWDIKNGFALFRTAYYEHSTQFSNQQGVCLNVEIENPESFLELNEYQLPLLELRQNSTLEIYRLLYSFQNDLPNDLLDIYCYESFISHFKKSQVKGKPEWINKIKESINDDPLSNLSLHKFSSEFQLHPNYIIRKFKEVTGYKLSEYLTKIRLEYSIQELSKDASKMTEVALNSGFYDQSHFNKNFKKHLNSTPTKFRKSLKRLV